MVTVFNSQGAAPPFRYLHSASNPLPRITVEGRSYWITGVNRLQERWFECMLLLLLSGRSGSLAAEKLGCLGSLVAYLLERGRIKKFQREMHHDIYESLYKSLLVPSLSQMIQVRTNVLLKSTYAASTFDAR